MKESDYLIDKNGLFDRFRKFPFLSTIDDKHLRTMLSLSKMRKYYADEVITQEGEYDSYMYIIITGQVRVMKQGERISRLRKQGDTFGELAIIDGQTRSASVIADIDSILLAIDVSFIDRLEQHDRNEFCAVFYKYLAEILAHRLRETDKSLIEEKEEITRIRVREKIQNFA